MIKNNTDAKFLDELVDKVFKKTIGLKHDITILDWDLDRVYLKVDNYESDIRMWNVWDGQKKNTLRIQWTLFQMIDDGDGSGHGEELGYGVSIVNTDKEEIND